MTHQCIYADEFLVRVTNARMIKNPPDSIDDLNMIFDVEVSSKSKDGLFANVHSLAGSFFSEARIVFYDGKKLEKFGTRGLLPLSSNETETFSYVPGGETADSKYKKVATICTDIKNEITSVKNLSNAKEIKSFDGSLKFNLNIFSITKGRFLPCSISIGFTANRLPIGNVMDFSMEDLVIKEQ